MGNIETGRTAEIGFLKYAARKLAVASVSLVTRSEHLYWMLREKTLKIMRFYLLGWELEGLPTILKKV